MPTVNETLGNFLDAAIKHPKSTIQSLLSGVYAITLLLMGMGTLSSKVSSIIVSVNTVAKVLLGMSQHDSIPKDKVPAEDKNETLGLVQGSCAPSTDNSATRS